MNAEEMLRKAHTAVLSEEKRLTMELAKVKAARQMIEQAIRAQGSTLPASGRAYAGGLKTAIIDLLAKSAKPMGNAAIRDALAKSGYAHSLTMSHVSKTLTTMYQAKIVKRIGSGTSSQYLRK